MDRTDSLGIIWVIFVCSWQGVRPIVDEHSASDGSPSPIKKFPESLREDGMYKLLVERVCCLLLVLYLDEAVFVRD